MPMKCMKRTLELAFLLFSICIASLSAYGANTQEAKVSISMNNVKTKIVLDEIERQTDYLFLFDPKEIDTEKLTSIQVKDQAVMEVLKAVFNGTGVSYKQEGTSIFLLKNGKETVPSVPQNRQVTISGTVKDKTGQTVIGANVVEKGRTNGTVTDIDGHYQLEVAPNAVLHISYIGYTAQDIPTNGKNVIDITLSDNTQALEEVVVVGYGTMKKKDLTGSVSSIKSEDIRRSPVTSLDQSIQGKAAGVQVTQASSAPGGKVSIRIRGGNSLSSSNEPLYVVDGFPISAGASAGGNGAGQNPLSTLSVSDIESIEILKDASATAVYGSRGANGVVLITTKRGKEGKVQVTLDAYAGIQKAAKKLDMMNAREFAEFANEARANDNLSPIFPNKNDLYNFPDPSGLGEGVDYQDEVFRNAPVQSYSLNVTGGSETVKYAFGGGYFGQTGIVKNSDFNRATFRSNIDSKITKNFTLSANLTASHVWAKSGKSEGDGGGSSGSVMNATLMTPATVPIRQADGTYTLLNPTPNGSTVPNPVPIVEFAKDAHTINRFLGTIEGKWDIMDHLNLRVTFGADMSSANRDEYWPKETVKGHDANGSGAQYYRRDASYLNENILTYNNVFGDHSINAMAGYTWQIFTAKSFNSSASNFISDLYGNDNLGAGTVIGKPGSSRSKSQLASYLGRLNYTYKGKYMFTFTARADGSSRFGVNNKWAFFPSAALAWRVSEEKFMDPFRDYLSSMKLRVSYGKSGNQNIGSYKSLATLGIMDYVLGGARVAGIGPDRVPNPDLKWETTATTDVGVDLGFFNNRLTFVADYYYKKTTDLLWNITLPRTSGFSSIFKNIGSMENKGVELSLGGDIFVSAFTWNSQLNWSRNRNKVLKIPGFTPSVQGTVSGSLQVDGSWLEPGLPIGVWNFLKYDGVFRNQAQLDAGPHVTAKDRLGDPRFVDKNKDGVINYTDDRMIVGDPNPDFIFGWTNNFTYKGFDLSVYIQGSYGNDILNAQRVESNCSAPWGNQRREMLGRWTPENPNTDIPRATTNKYSNLGKSSWLIEDGSYLRFKTITLGYTFDKLKFMKALRVYFTGQNLFTITSYSGFDPEVNSQGNSNLQLGVDYNAYPLAKSYIVGLNATF